MIGMTRPDQGMVIIAMVQLKAIVTKFQGNNMKKLTKGIVTLQLGQDLLIGTGQSRADHQEMDTHRGAVTLRKTENVGLDPMTIIDVIKDVDLNREIVIRRQQRLPLQMS